MSILGYGEDALTLWAMNHRIEMILRSLKDSSDYRETHIFFRPSFGRRGGDTRSEFGEFDFIILSKEAVYLGESKWNSSSESLLDGNLKLRDEQKRRHLIFKAYVEKWMSGPYDNWIDFHRDHPYVCILSMNKPIARPNTLLASNLENILVRIRALYDVVPQILNVLLYFYDSRNDRTKRVEKCDDFILVEIDYSMDAVGNFIKLS